VEGILPSTLSDANSAPQSLLRLFAYAGSRGIGSPEPPSIRNACICWRAFLSVYFSGYWLVAFATGDKVEDGGAEVGEAFFADAFAAEQGGGGGGLFAGDRAE
jgi:hypothetical protein